VTFRASFWPSIGEIEVLGLPTEPCPASFCISALGFLNCSAMMFIAALALARYCSCRWSPGFSRLLNGGDLADSGAYVNRVLIA